MQGTFVCRRAASDDAEGIAARIGVLGYPTDASMVCERLASLAESAADAVFVATLGQPPEILGVASAHALPLFHVPGKLVRLTALAVRAEAQRRGVGRALVAAVEAWGWESGCIRAEITSGAQRTEAHAFYEAIGYEPTPQRFVRHRPA